MPQFIATLSRLIAHRGASAFAPENTLAALHKAAELGASWVEGDVMLDSRNEPIIFHDKTLRRTTNGQGRVSQTPYTVISQLDAGGWYGADFRGERVPTLEAWLQTAADLGLGINIELKAVHSKADALAETVAVHLARHWKTGLPVPMISSTSVDCLMAMHRQTSAYLLAFVTDDWRSKWRAILSQFDGVSLNINHQELTPERVKQVKSQNILVLAYTVNDRDRANALFDMGVDAIFSDNPQLLLPDDINSLSIPSAPKQRSKEKRNDPTTKFSSSSSVHNAITTPPLSKETAAPGDTQESNHQCCCVSFFTRLFSPEKTRASQVASTPSYPSP